MTWKLLADQPELKPYENEIDERMRRLKTKTRTLLKRGQKLTDFANGHLYFGLHRTPTGWVYREWAPAADKLCLTGDFNGWNRESHPLKRCGDGNWEIVLEGRETLPHLSDYKVSVEANGERMDRIPLYATYVRQDEVTKAFSATVWDPEEPFVWHDADFDPKTNQPPLIYEAHVGMATEERRVGTYREFADNILPRIREDGYNTVQLMAIMEHPYYGSFGYQVSNFFAASSRFGTPDDLKYLVDRAHALGLSVLLDLVHSHAVKNTLEGINRFDGTNGQFFKEGAAGDHPAWGSKVFDYAKPGVLHFLLSNLKFWLTEYHFDGFRFDGAGSMLYQNHGLGTSFGGMKCYFSLNTDVDALTYLQLASQLTKAIKPHALLIAEDVSAMPGLCRPVREGGIGFDYRLSMGLPDFFIKTIKERPYGAWDMDALCWELLGCRKGEKRIAYAESHDQALVGDQTIIFRLAGADMYRDMDHSRPNQRVENAVAMHKLVRLVTIAAGGEGYLNFMGNEFGHPEWIDFPREGNGWSYDYARRQWSLADNDHLRYKDMGEFDRAMVRLFADKKLLRGGVQCLRVHQADQLMMYRRKGYIFAINFHPTNSQTAAFVPAPAGEKFVPVFSSDDEAFGGQGRVSLTTVYRAGDCPGQSSPGFFVYLPAMTAIVFRKRR